MTVAALAVTMTCLAVGVLLLSHVPDVFARSPLGVPLTVAGHTHGGQVVVPGYGPLRTMSRLPRRMAHGLHERDGRWLYVSAGVGTTNLPLRFARPPGLASWRRLR